MNLKPKQDSTKRNVLVSSINTHPTIDQFITNIGWNYTVQNPSIWLGAIKKTTTGHISL